MSEPGRIITNDEGDDKVAAMLGRLYERVEWIRVEAADRQRQQEAMFGLLQQLRDTTAKLGTAVEIMAKDFAITQQQGARIILLERDMALLQVDVVANTEFRKQAIKYLAVTGLLSLLGSMGIKWAITALATIK